MVDIDNYLDNHYIHRSNWLRAAVLGANDGILSITSIAIGIAAASSTREPIVLATIAGLVAGALAMAAGEYVSVSSQMDTEKADIAREAQELQDMPEEELQILATIYEQRGLSKETAMQVAIELTAKDALAAHVRDELGINEISQANPIQAALASGAARESDVGPVGQALGALAGATTAGGVSSRRSTGCRFFQWADPSFEQQQKQNRSFDNNNNSGGDSVGFMNAYGNNNDNNDFNSSSST